MNIGSARPSKVTAAVSMLFFALISIASSAVVPFKIGIVSSMTGAFTDWNSTLGGYLFWQKTMNSKLLVKDKNTQYTFSFSLNIQDDTSNAATAKALVTNLSASEDFIMNAQPSFAVDEAAIVSTVLGGNPKLNIHPVTTNFGVFQPQPAGVFGLAPNAATFTDALFQSYKLNSFTNIVFFVRSDNPELAAQCKLFVDGAKSLLLNTVEKSYTGADNLTALALSVNSTSFDALVGCIPSSEAALVYNLFNQLKKPIKNIFLTQGPTNQTWANNIVPGNTSASQALSQYITGPAIWASTIPSTSYGSADTIFGSASSFSLSFQSSMGYVPDDRAAAAAAAGHVLYLALSTKAFASCVIDPSVGGGGGDAHQLLYNLSAVTCTDGSTLTGMQRVINSVKNLAASTFFGNIAFDRYGMNYQAISAVAQIFTAQVSLVTTNVPFLVSPASLQTKSFTVPQPNRYKAACPLGYYANSYIDYLPCIPCPKGSYSDITGATSCQLAAKGSYSDTVGAAQMKPCPNNTDTDGKGSSHLEDCYCQVGFYSKTRQTGTVCVACPMNLGAVTSTCAGNTSWPMPAVGWYAEPNAPFTMYNCNPNPICNGPNLTNICAPGYAKRMCAYCDKGYFSALNRCYPCPSNPNLNIFYMAIMFVGYIVINLGTVRYIEAFHFGVGYCQLLAILNMFNTNWPNNIQTLFNYASILAFETNIVQPQCVNPDWAYPQNLVTQLMMPLVILACTLLWLLTTWLMFKIKMVASGKDSTLTGLGAMSFAAGSEAGSTKSKNSFASFGSKSLKVLASNTWVLAAQAWFHVPSSPSEMIEVIYDRMAIPTMFLNASFLANLLLTLQSFYCYDFMGTQYMYYNPQEACYTPNHYTYMMIAAAGLIFYVFGYFVFLAVVLRHLRKTRSFGEKVPLLLFGWVYERYKAELYWYEIISLSQRTFFVVIAVFALQYPDIQLLCAFGIEAMVLLTDVRFVPFIDEVSHSMNHACDLIVLVTTVIGIVYYNPLILPSTLNGMEIFLYFMIGLNFLFLVLVICYDGFLTAYLAILKGKHSKIAKKWGHSVRRYKAMYNVFTPIFMFQWLTKARVDDWQEWHKLCVMVADYARPTSEVSWLSHKKIARFWRYLLANFPEVLDYLLSVDDEQRNAFSTFIDVMYEHFFESGEENHSQLYQVVSARYAAPVGLFLANASEQDIAFFQRVLKNAFEKGKGKEGARQITLAMSRSKSQHSMSHMADKALSSERSDKGKQLDAPVSPSQLPFSPKPPPLENGIGRNSSRSNILTLDAPPSPLRPSVTSPVPMVAVEGSLNSMTLPQPPNPPASSRPSRLGANAASAGSVVEKCKADEEAEEMVAEEMTMNEITKIARDAE